MAVKKKIIKKKKDKEIKKREIKKKKNKLREREDRWFEKNTKVLFVFKFSDLNSLFCLNRSDIW